jgi:hypothetical protein
MIEIGSFNFLASRYTPARRVFSEQVNKKRAVPCQRFQNREHPLDNPVDIK